MLREATEIVPATEEVPQPQAGTWSGTESDIDASVPELREQDSTTSTTAAAEINEEPFSKTKQSWSKEREGTEGYVQTGMWTGSQDSWVSIQTSENIISVITKPEVCKSPASDDR